MVGAGCLGSWLDEGVGVDRREDEDGVGVAEDEALFSGTHNVLNSAFPLGKLKSILFWSGIALVSTSRTVPLPNSKVYFD